jgi:pimeloyl-ACP methyl ester carboxylesterase
MLREDTAMTEAQHEFVFLHGLTFDHRMWEPVLRALPDGAAAIAPDLPGHGGASLIAGRGLHPVAEHVHQLVAGAGFERPVVVGHSIGGPIATIYAGDHPAAGVVSVDTSLRFEPFAAGLRAIRPQLEGPEFDAAWDVFKESMRLERVPSEHRELVRAGDRASQQVVLQYQADLLERPLADVIAERDAGMEQLRRERLPYLALFGSEIDAEERAWYARELPHAQVEAWPVGHHFPHLADPVGFAERVTAFAEATRVGAPAV